MTIRIDGVTALMGALAIILAFLSAVGLLLRIESAEAEAKQCIDWQHACQTEFLRQIIDGGELDPTTIYDYCFFSSRNEKTDREY